MEKQSEIIEDNHIKRYGANTTSTANATVLQEELAWLSTVLQTRLELHFQQETLYDSIDELVPPIVVGKEGSYANFINKHKLNFEERLLLILALVPHIKPEVLDILLTKNKDYDRRFSEFGGLILEGHLGLVPTAETAMFLLAGDDLQKRLLYQALVSQDFIAIRHGMINMPQSKGNAPLLSGIWMIANEYVASMVTGIPYQAIYSPDFPAQRLHTRLSWQDLIVSRSTARSLQEIRDWLMHGQTVLETLELRKRLKPGYKSLFYGPPGTGKSMAAALLGKSTGMQVYKIDLSMTVSKYIGETEKNLAKVFDQAQQHNWILFFDEADSLFGQRTQVSSANDRYGNQEIGYLLQRIEDFPGVVLLASNLKDNIDEAFTRRFQSMIEFKMPGVEERYHLWQQSFAKKLPLDDKTDLWKIAENYNISGGLMMNVIRKCTLQAVTNEKTKISQQNLETAIRQELQKEGVILS
ncbi:ATP-binding protein [Aquimarina sp. D1M17]|uniref:ATP-binding protein n=1 Tax=Aquimarina acroporae TaxID=2937283 RepID=UPI0020BE2CFC|nr:ATP-binding protein [Aquimarina acroporae]MCK8521024.1 ATP-binding protein [Aquimarina acroporae]